MVIRVVAPTSTKMFYEAKHALGAFTIVEVTNAISLIITSVSLPQRVYESSIRFHLTTNISTMYNLPTTKL
jgi:hypothetical protein